MKSDSLPVKWVEDGLLFEDGEILKADVVVFATGFDNNLKNQVSQLFGKETAEKMGDWCGCDKEGEMRGAYRPGGRKTSLDLTPSGELLIQNVQKRGSGMLEETKVSVVVIQDLWG